MKRKALIQSLSYSLFTSLLTSFLIYFGAKYTLIKMGLDRANNVAMAINRSIDPEIHETFIKPDSKKTKEYQNLYQLIKAFRLSNKDLNISTYTVSSSGIQRFAVEVLLNPNDVIVIIIKEPYSLAFLYQDGDNSEYYFINAADFAAGLWEEPKLKKVEFNHNQESFSLEIVGKELFLNNKELLKLETQEGKLSAVLPTGISINTNNRRVFFTSKVTNKPINIVTTYIDRGDYGSDPGYVIQSTGINLLNEEKYLDYYKNAHNCPENKSCINQPTEIKEFNNQILYLKYPILNGEKISGFINIGYNIKNLEHLTLITTLVSIFMGCIILLVSLLISNKIIQAYQKPLNQIIDFSKKIRLGNYDSRLPDYQEYEFQEVSSTLNTMNSSIEKTTKVMRKFVPEELLNMLGHNHYYDTNLGDQKLVNMTILFSDIRSFTSISEAMQPAQIFNFVNRYFSKIGPAIRNNNGYIDKYIGDAIMALFPQRPDDALQAAIELLENQQLLNTEQKDLPVVSTGIGIHTGNLILGIIGEESRFEGTVISDAVNASARIEGLTKLYGSSILISGETYAKLETPENFRCRTLDLVKVKGKSKAIEVIEVIEGLSERIINLKLKTKESFLNGVYDFRKGDFIAARQAFQDVIAVDPKDLAAKLYLERCLKLEKGPLPDDWDGSISLEFK